MQKIIVFDFDYTLGDSTHGIALSINYALTQLGHTTGDIDAIRKTIGLSLRETYFTLTGSRDSAMAEQFAKFFKEKDDEVMVPNTVLYAGVKETLVRLKDSGYRLAIVTTKFHYRIEQILYKFAAVLT